MKINYTRTLYLFFCKFNSLEHKFIETITDKQKYNFMSDKIT